jgi:hypothetical protein
MSYDVLVQAVAAASLAKVLGVVFLFTVVVVCTHVVFRTDKCQQQSKDKGVSSKQHLIIYRSFKDSF